MKVTERLVGTYAESAAANVNCTAIANLAYELDNELVYALYGVYRDFVDDAAARLREFGEPTWADFIDLDCWIGAPNCGVDIVEDMFEGDLTEKFVEAAWKWLPRCVEEYPGMSEIVSVWEFRDLLKKFGFELDVECFIEDVVERANYYKDDTLIWFRTPDEVSFWEEARR